MIDEKMVKFAIKGIEAEIDELEKSINRGKQFLLQYENGQKPKTSKTEYEIKSIILNKKSKIEELAKIKSDYEWLLVENEQ